MCGRRPRVQRFFGGGDDLIGSSHVSGLWCGHMTAGPDETAEGPKLHRATVSGQCPLVSLRPSPPGGSSGCRESCAVRRRSARRSTVRRTFSSVDDAADHPAVIHPSLASCVSRQVGLNARELIVHKPEAILVHERPLDEAVNHKTQLAQTALWVRTLRLGHAPLGVPVDGADRPGRTRRPL